jgi:hypothetical protein
MANIVQYITYKGEQWPVRISYYAIKKFQEETKRDIAEIEQDISLLEVLLWYGLLAGHIAEGKPMTLKRDEMEFILDESMAEFNDAILTFFPLGTPDVSGKSKKK